ncbi:hypothetical protein Pfo_005037 [Paulownia fortunei]|nr:hypothetical protein Pfo_005037 [Paulownia fortunei]
MNKLISYIYTCFMCIWIIEQFQKCHIDHPLGKFFGECTDLKIKLDKCFLQEKALKRKANFEESKKLKERLRAYRKENSETREEKTFALKLNVKLDMVTRNVTTIIHASDLVEKLHSGIELFFIPSYQLCISVFRLEAGENFLLFHFLLVWGLIAGIQQMEITLCAAVVL